MTAVDGMFDSLFTKFKTESSEKQQFYDHKKKRKKERK